MLNGNCGEISDILSYFWTLELCRCLTFGLNISITTSLWLHKYLPPAPVRFQSLIQSPFLDIHTIIPGMAQDIMYLLERLVSSLITILTLSSKLHRCFLALKMDLTCIVSFTALLRPRGPLEPSYLGPPRYRVIPRTTSQTHLLLAGF
jgi:hypothetical protein